MELLFWAHPTALSALLLLFWGRAEWPERWVSLGWMVAPVLLNSPLWEAGSRLLGWQFGSTGGYLYFWIILPLNGLLLGISAPQVLHAGLRRCRSAAVEFALGMLVEVALLSVNLAILSRVDAVVSGAAS